MSRIGVGVGVGLWRRRAGGGAEPLPLRVVTAPNWHPTGMQSASGSNTRFIARRPIYIGVGGASELVCSYFNVWAGVGGSGAFTVVSAAIEAGDGSMSVPVTFDSGVNRSKSIAFGTSDVQSDPIRPSAFALTKFDAGTLFWERIVFDAPSGNTYPANVPRRPSYVGMAAYVCNPATFPTLTADGTGALDATGKTLISGKTFGAIVLGRPLTAGTRHFGNTGDSFTRDSDMETAAGTYPLRLFADVFERAMIDFKGDLSGLYGFINFGIYGTGVIAYSPSTDARRPYYKYCTDMHDEYGTNDTGGATLVGLQGRLMDLWGAYVAEGVERIWRTKLWPVATSTDNWATDANQTPTALQLPGGIRYELNNWFDTKAADGTLAGVIPWGRSRSPTDFEKVRTSDNVALWSVSGGHPTSGIGVPLMASEARSIMIPAPTTVPSQVGNLALSAADTAITATWDAATNSPSDHLVEISSDGGSTWATLHTYDPCTTYKWTGLTPSTPYRVRVTAINCKGAGASSAVTISTQATPSGRALDGLSAAPVQALSSRRLRSAYTGPAYFGRRMADGLEAPIGFNSAGDLDVEWLLRWALGGDVLLKRAYDQSGGGYNQDAGYVSGGVAEWPILVQAGVLNTVEGRAAPLFGGSRCFRLGALTAVPPNNARSVISVVRLLAVSNSGVIASGSTGAYHVEIAATGRIQLLKYLTTTILQSTGAALAALNATLVSVSYDGTNAAIWLDKVASGTATNAQTFTGAGTTTYGDVTAGTPGAVVNGAVPERVTWDGAALSTPDRQAVENSAAAYWST
ncbi:fibronectin type III domain-containing protein [Ancylobacter sp.]|uniref:fibronectin type III domain-containing protein n=1 Tax=Ancylobacter sp. TaxID=1872567 RepID=UPI003D140ACD